MRTIFVKNGKNKLILIPESESEKMDLETLDGATISIVRGDLSILNERINGSLLIEKEIRKEDRSS